MGRDIAMIVMRNPGHRGWHVEGHDFSAPKREGVIVWRGLVPDRSWSAA